MKKTILAIVVLICNHNLFAQETESNNEIRFNIPYAIAGLPEISYERVVDDNMSIGISTAVAIEKPYNYDTDKGLRERSFFCPYYRLFFGKKRAAGFYIEGNMAVVGQREKGNVYNYITGTYNYVDAKATSFGFGASIGLKLLSKNGFTGDFYGGWGRLFGNPIITSGYPRFGVCMGKRF